jgi:hypothetical protein
MVTPQDGNGNRGQNDVPELCIIVFALKNPTAISFKSSCGLTSGLTISARGVTIMPCGNTVALNQKSSAAIIMPVTVVDYSRHTPAYHRAASAMNWQEKMCLSHRQSRASAALTNYELPGDRRTNKFIVSAPGRVAEVTWKHSVNYHWENEARQQGSKAPMRSRYTCFTIFVLFFFGGEGSLIRPCTCTYIYVCIMLPRPTHP